MPQPEPTPPQRNDPLRIALPLAIFLLTFAAFARSLSGGFSDFDDFAVLFKVDGYRGLAPANIAWDFSSIHMGHWQPLTWMSYGLDYLVWGLDPKTGAPGFHLTNILLHAANAVLVYLLAIRLMTAAGRATSAGPRPPRPVLLGAAAAALFFSLSPLRVESVAWITERRDVLSTFFLLLAALAYLRAFPPASVKPSSPRSYWLTVGLLLLSLLAKSWGMSFFVIATILDIYPLRRLPADPRRWLEATTVFAQKLPLAALGVAALVVAGYAQSRSYVGVARSLEEWGIGPRLVQATYGLYFYAAKTIAPVRLSALYDMPVKLDPLELRFLAAYAAVIVGAAAVWVLRRRAPGLAAAAACYVVTVAPVLGFFQSGIQFVADRYSYVSCIGWAVLVGAGVAWLLREGAPRRARALTGAASLAVAAAFSLGTWVQIGYWADAVLLWRHTLDVGWDGPTLRQYLAIALDQRHDVEGAQAQYRAAVEMNPRQGGAWFPYANLLRDKGDLAAAERAYQNAVPCMTEPWKALTALGLLYLNQLDRPQDAVQVLRAAVRDVERPDRSPGTAPGGGGWPYLLLASALWEVGDLNECRGNLLIAAKYPETKEQALQKLPEVEAELRKPR